MVSRLNKNLERRSRNRLILTVIGTLFILFVLIKYGIPALINFSLFMGGGNNAPQNTTQGSQYVAVPMLNPTFTATNSATVTLTGNAVAKEKIELYVNNNLLDSQDTKNDGTFTFKNVTLENGSNTIKVQAKNGNNMSDFSDPLTIVYKTTAPTLLIESPADGAQIPHDQQTVTVSGKSDPDVKVTVNDFWTVEDDSGNYSYQLNLHDADNVIKVDAVDAAGNKTERVIKVFRQ